MSQNPLTNPPRSEVIPEPKYSCSGKGCETKLAHRGYCTPCHRAWEQANRAHRRAYVRARTAGITPPRKVARRARSAAEVAAERARAQVIAAYGAACSVCGTTARDQLVVVATAHDGQPAAPHASGHAFYTILIATDFPRQGSIGGRPHQIALRCKACARHPR